MATSCLLYLLALNCLEHVKKTLVEAPQKLPLFKRSQGEGSPGVEEVLALDAVKHYHMHLLQSAARRPKKTANKTQKDEHYLRSDDKRH